MGQLKKIFIIRYQDVILDYVFQALDKMGYEVAMIESQSSTSKDMHAAVEKFQPDLILMGNLDCIFSHPEGTEVEGWLTSGRFAVCCWYFEAPRMSGGLALLMRWERGPYPKNIYFLETDRDAVVWYTSRGLKCDHLRLAVDPRAEFWRPPDVSVPALEVDVVFSGSPHLELEFSVAPGRAALADIHRAGYIQKLAMTAANFKMDEAELAPALSILSQLSYEFLMEDIWKQEEYEHRFAQTAAKILPHLRFKRAQDEFQVFAVACLHVSYSFVQLSALLDKLIETHSITLFGSPMWERILSRYGKPTPRLTIEDLKLLYRRAKINVSLTKRTFQSFIHERAFHVLAYGGFPLVDWRAELPECFKSNEIVAYKDSEECNDLISFYKKNDGMRECIIKNGRARVLRDHTYFNRTVELLDYCRRHFGFSSSAPADHPPAEVPSEEIAI